MGWWRSGRNPDDILGDGPADVVQQELEHLADSSDTKPTFQALLDALAAALAMHAAEALADPGAYRGQPIVARFEPPAAPLESRAADASAPARAALESALMQIAAEYDVEQSRRPTLGEVLGSIAFVLRVRPERYVSGVDGRALVDLSAAR